MKKVKVPWSFSQKIVTQLLSEATLDALPYFAGKLLDVGCGRKPYCSFFYRIKGLKWVGLDFPLSASGKTEADVYGDAMNIPFKTEVFDTVFCSQVIEHVSEPAGLMKEMARVLKPGGHIILTAPQTWCLHEEPHDYFRFTRYGLSYLAKKNGLILEYVKPYGGTFALLGQLITLHAHFDQPILRPLNVMLSLSFLLLDRVWLKQKDTLGHILVCTKPMECA